MEARPTVVHFKAGTFLPVTENWIFRQIEGLREYAAVVYCLDRENAETFFLERIRSLQLSKARPGPWTIFNKGFNRMCGMYLPFLFYLMADKPVLAHAHFGPSGYGFLQLKKLFNIPLITTFYGVDMSVLPRQSPKWGKRYAQLFEEGELFLCEGPHMRESLIALGCPPEKVEVLRLGVDLDRIGFSERGIDDDEKIRVLVSASFREKKGIPFALQAFGEVRKAHPELQLSLTVIGTAGQSSAEQAERQKILAVVDQYGLSDTVSFLGAQPHDSFLRALADHHIFLHPSVTASDGDSEGGAPVSIIEASASGMPVLSTLHCDIPSVVLDGLNGLLAPERDVDSLAEKLECLVLNPSFWTTFGRAGRKHIEENHDAFKQSRRLEEIYRSLISAKV